MSFRIEQDLLGERKVPKASYFGIQTLRAKENFPITGISIASFPNLIKSLAMVKKAAVRANSKLCLIEKPLADAIESACEDIINGALQDQFVVDLIQGGAGTSTNMNANEVIANLALEKLGAKKGCYSTLHPNNHVNLSQSTNDVYPTAVRLCILLSYRSLYETIENLCYALKQKSVEFSSVIKMGRTQLQDAVPMTLGQEFDAYYATLKEDLIKLQGAIGNFREVNLGATAIGTGINADPEYATLAIEELCRISGERLEKSTNLIEATSDMGAFVTFSGTLKRTAVKVSKICNDLRLLSSGPRAGINEINLPVMQPGSSIMPGKVNPVIPEVVNQVAYQVIGSDLVVTLAAEAGQLQLNAMEPVIVYNILNSIRLMENALRTLTERCITGITANEILCRDMVYSSMGLVTAVSPHIGYQAASRIVKEAEATGESVVDIIKRDKLLSDERLAELLKPENMTQPRKLGAE